MRLARAGLCDGAESTHPAADAASLPRGDEMEWERCYYRLGRVGAGKFGRGVAGDSGVVHHPRFSHVPGGRTGAAGDGCPHSTASPTVHL